MSVSAVEGPHQAIKLLEKDSSFDLIITDFIMPEMNGAELIDELRRQNYTTPIILMSGYDDYQTLTQNAEYLPDIRIQKPITLPQLKRLLAETQDQVTSKKAG